MPKKSFAKRRLEALERNKRKLKNALSSLPAIPGAPLPYRIVQSAGAPLVDASSIAFQQELLLKRLIEQENRLAMNRQMAQDIQPLSQDTRVMDQPTLAKAVLESALVSAVDTIEVVEQLLETLPEEVLSDTEAVNAIVADLRTGREVIRDSRQFSRANLVGGIDLSKPKRTRKKTKTDKKMSKALRLANERFRKKNGSMRKGATQSKIMKYAHRLLRKM